MCEFQKQIRGRNSAATNRGKVYLTRTGLTTGSACLVVTSSPGSTVLEMNLVLQLSYDSSSESWLVDVLLSDRRPDLESFGGISRKEPSLKDPMRKEPSLDVPILVS